MAEIKAVISDWSGTVSDDRIPVYNANMKLLDYFKKPKMSLDVFLSGSTLNAPQFLRKHGVNFGTEDDLQAMYKKFYDAEVRTGSRPILYSDVTETLKFLHERGIRMSVLSSHPEESLIREAKGYGIYDHFDIIKGNSKNKAEDMRALCGEMREDAACSIYVDDTIWGMRAAKDAGVKSGAITTGYHSLKMLKAENPDFVLSKYSDMKKIITEALAPDSCA
jgi:phosphoglycolate phosphatase